MVVAPEEIADPNAAVQAAVSLILKARLHTAAGEGTLLPPYERAASIPPAGSTSWFRCRHCHQTYVLSAAVEDPWRWRHDPSLEKASCLAHEDHCFHNPAFRNKHWDVLAWVTDALAQRSLNAEGK